MKLLSAIVSDLKVDPYFTPTDHQLEDGLSELVDGGQCPEYGNPAA